MASSTEDENQNRVLSIIRFITAPISIISSGAIIYLISAKSNSKFGTTQNRLLVALSFFDIVSSIAMLLGPIPMPSDTENAWLALGNTSTCDSQGFLFVVGNMMTSSINAGMCIFFLLKIRYNISDHTIKTRVEPLLYLVPFAMIMTGSIYFLTSGSFNPNMEVNMCYAADYPLNCSINPDVPCERGENAFESWAYIGGGVIHLVIVPVTIFSTMTVIYMTVLEQERKMATYGRGSLTSVTVQETDRQLPFHVRIVMYRGLAYSGAWLVTYIFPSVMLFGSLISDDFRPSFVLKIFLCIFHPLQGFFNFIVFMYPKLRSTQEIMPELSFYQAFVFACTNMDDARLNTTRNRRRQISTPVRRRRRPRSHNSMIIRSVGESMSDLDKNLSFDNVIANLNPEFNQTGIKNETSNPTIRYDLELGHPPSQIQINLPPKANFAESDLHVVHDRIPLEQTEVHESPPII